jgi:hypothetical protein
MMTLIHRNFLGLTLAVSIALSLGIHPLCAARRDQVTPDSTARFLAGLSVTGTPLEKLSQDRAWTKHATEFEKAWKDLDARQLSKIRSWESEHFREGASSQRPMFYFFSGPDILYAQEFYPKASTYVLAGLEPVGTPPDLMSLPAGTLGVSLSNLRKSLESVLSFSFFKTKDMKTDLGQNQLNGTLPVLYIFLARTGCKLERTELVWLDDAGSVVTSKTSTPGARITFSRGGERQALYYFQTDLSDGGIDDDPGFLRFCGQLGTGTTLLKAASYLPHSGNFSTARDFLLKHCAWIVQDDSGIPINRLDSAHWDVRCFGNYPGPIDLFKENFQPALATMYQKPTPPVPFAFGYRWRPKESSLILAKSRGTKSSKETAR